MRDQVGPQAGAVSLVLPLPPTVNSYYGIVPGTQKRYLSKQAKNFRHDVAVLCEQAGARGAFLTGNIQVTVVLHFKRGGDVDNRNKPLLDALQEAQVFGNDRQIKRLVVEVGAPMKGGQCEVVIEAL